MAVTKEEAVRLYRFERENLVKCVDFVYLSNVILWGLGSVVDLGGRTKDKTLERERRPGGLE